MLYAGAKDIFMHIQAPTTPKARRDISKDIKRHQKTSKDVIHQIWICYEDIICRGAKDIFKRLRHKKTKDIKRQTMSPKTSKDVIYKKM